MAFYRYGENWQFVLFKGVAGIFSILRIYSLQGPTMSCTHIVVHSRWIRDHVLSTWLIFELTIVRVRRYATTWSRHVTFPYVGNLALRSSRLILHALLLCTWQFRFQVRLFLQLSVLSSCDPWNCTEVNISGTNNIPG